MAFFWHSGGMKDLGPTLPHDDTIAAVWPVAGDRRRVKAGRHPMYNTLRLGFVALAVLAFLALLGVGAVSLHWPQISGPAYLALININIVLGGLLVLYVARRVVVMLLDRRGRLRGGRLHGRVLGIFAILAVLPALGVGGVSIYLLNQGIEGWFAAKVSAALEGGRQVAEGYLEESGRGLLGEVMVLSRDSLWQLPPLLLDHSTVAAWLRAQMSEKRLDELALVDNDGQVLATGSGFVGTTLSQDTLGILQSPLRAAQVFRTGDGNRLIAVAPIRNGWWLVGQRGLDSTMLARIAGTAAAYNDYGRLQEHRGQIRLVTTLFLLLLLGATVALAVWTAIRLANRIVQPVTMLVHGTNRVSAGDLSVRLEPRDDDELGVLTQAFNRMTLQLSANRDLLERKNRELDDRRRFMEAVLTGVTAGVVAVDDAGVIRVANQSAQVMLKVAPGDKLSRAVPELSEVVRELLRNEGGPVFGQKVLQQREVKVTVAEGDTRTLLVRLVPQAGHGEDHRMGGVVLTFDDITPLIGAQRLAAWQDVARRLAHEIKNPLTPIQLSAERLKRRYLAKMPEEDKQLFGQLADTIVQQAEEMRRMTNEFSDFARMPQAVMQAENMVEVLDGVVTLQKSRGGIAFVTDFEEPLALVKADRGQLTRVFTNLIENACNAINERPQPEVNQDNKTGGKGQRAEDGSTKLPQGEVRIVVRKTQPDILGVEIQDNGCGLPDSVAVEQLFDPYVTTRKSGTGLGLAIVKRVMDEHGGTVRLLRRKGGGTTVALTFPLLEKEQEIVAYEHDTQPAQAQHTRDSGGGRRGRGKNRAGRDS